MEATTKRMELDYREAHGVTVTLSWDCVWNRVIVSVYDAGTDESFELAVEDANARDAFEHPFAYAAFRGVLGRQAQPVAA